MRKYSAFEDGRIPAFEKEHAAAARRTAAKLKACVRNILHIQLQLYKG